VQLFQLWWARRRPPTTHLDWYRAGSTELAALDRTFADLALLAAEQPVLLVPLPVRSTDPTEQIHLEAVAQLCRRHALQCLDIYARMLPYLSALHPEHPWDMLHFESAGHHAVADALAEPLSELIEDAPTVRGAKP